MIQYSIYIIDDEKALARAIAFNLRDEYQVETFFDAEAALEALQTELERHKPAELLITEQNQIKSILQQQLGKQTGKQSPEISWI